LSKERKRVRNVEKTQKVGLHTKKYIDNQKPTLVSSKIKRIRSFIITHLALMQRMKVGNSSRFRDP
jgi:hypothetical protein